MLNHDSPKLALLGILFALIAIVSNPADAYEVCWTEYPTICATESEWSLDGDIDGYMFDNFA